MKRTVLLLLVLVFIAAPFSAEAIVFKKGDKVVEMQTGKVYEFRLDADIGIYGADSGLGNLYVVNGKVYAITPEGVEGMRAVSNAVDLQKRYDEKRSEAGRAWKYLKAEKRKVKLLRKAIDNYKKAAEYYELAVKERDEEIAALKERITELEKIVGTANETLTESKGVLGHVKETMKRYRDNARKQEHKAQLFKAYMIILACIAGLAQLGWAIHFAHTLRKVKEQLAEPEEEDKPTEEMEFEDLADI